MNTSTDARERMEEIGDDSYDQSRSGTYGANRDFLDVLTVASNGGFNGREPEAVRCARAELEAVGPYKEDIDRSAATRTSRDIVAAYDLSEAKRRLGL